MQLWYSLQVLALHLTMHQAEGVRHYKRTFLYTKTLRQATELTFMFAYI